MNTKGFFSVLGLLSFILCATTVTAQNNRIVASSRYITKEIKIGVFDAINLLGSPTIEYTQSNNGKSELKVYGSDNLMDVLECEVVNKTLVVKYKPDTNIQFGKQGRLKVIASSPSIKDVRLQGSGDVIMRGGLKCADLSLTLQGSGDMKVGSIVCTNRFSANLQGSGDMDVESSLQSASVTLKLQGSGDLNVNSLTTKSAVASVQGSGDLQVKGAVISGEADIHLQGSGDLNMQGIRAEQVTAYLQGSGDMKLEGTTRRASLTLNNSGSLNARNLNATDVNAVLSGSGSITCAASGSLKSKTSGSGRVSYAGNPSNVESTGKSKPRKL